MVRANNWWRGLPLQPGKLPSTKNSVSQTNPAEPCQFVHATTWMRNAISELRKMMSPFRDVLKKSYFSTQSQKKKSVKKIRLPDMEWGDTYAIAFDHVKNGLRNAVELSHRNLSKIIWVHTDASDLFWSGIVTQCDPEELVKPKL